MSAPHRIRAKSTKHLPPVVFEIEDDEGNVHGPFRAVRKPRTDVMQLLASTVQLAQNGERIYKADLIADSIREVLCRKLWDPTALVPLDPQPENPLPEHVTNADGVWCTRGAWVETDDLQRFNALLADDRIMVDIQDLGRLCFWLLEEIAKPHPTGASSQ